MQSLTTALENLLRHLSQEIPATPGIRVIDIPFPLKDAFDALSWLASQQTYPQFYWQQRNGDEEAVVLGAITRFTSLDQAQRFLRQHPEHADLRIWGLNAFDPSQGNLLLPRLEWRRCGGKATLRLTLFSESSLQHDAIQAKEFIATLVSIKPLPGLHLTTTREQHWPDKTGWTQLIELATKTIAEGELDKVVLARATDLHFASPVNAAAMMAAGCMPVTPLPQPVLPDALAEPVKIGVLLPLSGADSEYGERTLRGVEFACSELNNGRGISDRRVELLVRDTKSSPAEARRQVEELSRQGIAGLVGPYSTNEALAIKPAVEALLIPTVVPLATNDEITAGTRMIYRACFTDSQQGEALAAYAWYWRKLLRLAIVVNLDDMATYSRSVALEAANAFSDLGGSVVHTVEFEGDKKEFGQKLRELVSYGPQAILISGEPGNAGRVVKYIRGLGYRGLLLGPESWDDPVFLRECGGQPGDCAFIGLYSGEFDLPEQLAFRQEFRRTNFIYPGSCEAQGYDALKLLAIGLSRAQSVEDFNRNMQSVRNHPGAAALYTLKPGGEIDRTMFVKTIRPAATPDSVPESRLSGSFTMRKIEQLKED